MTQFTSRALVPDDLDRRRAESWYGTQPVTLTRDGVSIRGTRQGRFGGVLVYRPNRDIDFGPDRGMRVWNSGMFAELPDTEWERMGWTISRARRNPTNPLLLKMREWGIPAEDLLWAIDHGASHPNDKRSKQLRTACESGGSRLKPFDGEWVIRRGRTAEGARVDEFVSHARLVASRIVSALGG